jgi:hypothetical protein
MTTPRHLLAGSALLLTVGALSACSLLGMGGPDDSGTADAAGTAASVAVSSTAPEPGEPPAATRSAAESSGKGSSDAPRSSRSSGVSAPVAETPVTDQPRTRTTDVQLTVVGWNASTSAVEAGGYVSPVVQSGGTCTLVLTQGAHRVTASGPGMPDATTTDCGNLSVPRSSLIPGTWTAVLHYSSATTAGTSRPSAVVVPR